MKPKKTPTPKRQPAAIVVGRNMGDQMYACRGADGHITAAGCFHGDDYTCVYMCEQSIRRLKIKGIRKGQYIRFVQDGGVRKARRVK